MQFTTSLRKPITAILMLSMATTTLGSFAQPASARGGGGDRRGIGDVINGVFNHVQNLKNDDKEKRARFTQETVNELSRKFPNYNFVVTRHKQSKVIGNSVKHKHVEMKQHVGTVGYEIYFAPKGKRFVFTLNGDGGFLNWAHRGDFLTVGTSKIAARVAKNSRE